MEIKMIYYILLGISIIFAVIKSSLYNQFAKTENPGMNGIFTFNTISYLTALVFASFFGLDGNISLPTIICSSFYGITVCSLQGLSVYAMKLGPMSATTIIVLYGMIIPTISGPLFWNEPFGLLQLSGVILMLISMFLLSADKEAKKDTDKKWFPIVIIIFFLSGLAGLFEKIHQSTSGKEEKIMFIFIAYLTMFIVSCAGKIISSRTTKKTVSIRKTLSIAVISGLVIGIYMFVNLTLAGKLNATVYYPVANGGALIFTVVASVTVFREKCTIKQIYGIITGLVSILMLSF